MERAERQQWQSEDVARLLFLVETEQRLYKEIIANLAIGVLVAGRQGEILSANEYAEHLLGSGRGTLAERRLIEVVPFPQLSERLEDVFRTNKSQRNVYCVRETEPTLALRVSIQPIHGFSDREPEEVLVIIENLRASEMAGRSTGLAATAQYLEEMNGMVWIAGAEDLKLRFLTGRVADLLGYSREEILSKRDLWPARVHSADREMVEQTYRNTLVAKGRASLEYRIVKSDGTEKWVRDWIQALQDTNEDNAGLIGLTIDATGSRAERQQLALKDKLAALERLSGSIGHETSNLLMILQGYSEDLIKRIPPEDRLRVNAEEILKACERFGALSEQIDAFLRKPQLHPEAVNLSSFLERKSDWLRAMLGEGTAIEQGRNSLHAFIDPVALDEVVENLAAITRQTRTEGGEVRIEISELDPVLSGPRPAGSAGFTWSYPSAGTGSDAANRSFEPVFSIEEGKQAAGTLQVQIHKIVSESGGQIHVEIEPGGQTIYTIVLPQPATPVLVKRETENKTVLIVEDREPIRRLMCKSLHEQGYNVLEAASAQAALDLFNSHEDAVLLVVTDVELPGMGGKELAEILTQQRPNLVFLYTSTFSHEEASLDVPGAQFLRKPFRMQSFTEKVRTLLSSNNHAAVSQTI